MGILKNEARKLSKTKLGAALIGLAGAVEAAAQVPGIPAETAVWMHVGATVLGALGAWLGGLGVRDVLGSLGKK